MTGDVSRETEQGLQIFEDLLRKWTKKINLVAPSTLNDLRTRHIDDSLQLYALIADYRGKVVDLGSGGGLPGAILAIADINNADRTYTLIEADQRKATFLRTVARESMAKFTVLSERIEEAPPQDADIITARALAPLTKLFEMCERHLKPGGIAFFLKGETAQEEIKTAKAAWSFSHSTYPSKTNPKSTVLKIERLARVSTPS